MTHSIIPPSSAGAWSKCGLWVLMNLTYPETEPTPESLEGEAAHQIAESMAHGYARGAPDYCSGDWVGKIADNGTVFTQEMYDAAFVWGETVGQVMRSAGVFGGPHLGIESKVHAHNLIHELSEGTPDLWLYDQNAHKVTIADFKFGHLSVEAFENLQLSNYLAGVFEELGFTGLDDQTLIVEFIVVQPRSFNSGGPVKRWTAKGDYFRGIFNQLNTAAHKALAQGATAVSGPHCRNCPGRHACTTALNAGLTLFEAAGATMPIDLSDVALGVQLTIVDRAIKALELLKTGYSAQVESKVRSGKNVPGWITATKYGREKWAKPDNEVILLGDMFGHDLRKPAEPITPKQAVKLGIDESVIKEYSTTPTTGMAVIPDTNNRAKQVFTQ